MSLEIWGSVTSRHPHKGVQPPAWNVPKVTTATCEKIILDFTFFLVFGCPQPRGDQSPVELLLPLKPFTVGSRLAPSAGLGARQDGREEQP